MKRNIFRGCVCFSLLCGALSYSKNYFLYHHFIHLLEEQKDLLEVRKIEWGWHGVRVSHLEFSSKFGNFLVEEGEIKHSWTSPLTINFSFKTLNHPLFLSDELKGDLEWGGQKNHVRNLKLLNTSFLLLKHQKPLKESYKISFGELTGELSFLPSSQVLELDLHIPSFKNKELSGVALGGKGKLAIHPHPQGKVDVTFKNLPMVIEALVENQIIKKKNISYLTLGAKILGGFTGSVSTLPLVLENNEVYMGPFKLY